MKGSWQSVGQRDGSCYVRFSSAEERDAALREVRHRAATAALLVAAHCVGAAYGGCSCAPFVAAPAGPFMNEKIQGKTMRCPQCSQ